MSLQQTRARITIVAFRRVRYSAPSSRVIRDVTKALNLRAVTTCVTWSRDTFPRLTLLCHSLCLHHQHHRPTINALLVVQFKRACC